MVTVLLVRHGETTWNRVGRVQGWAPVPLTDRGHEQAEALAAYVTDSYDVDRLVSSDLLRAQETTRHLSRATGVDPDLDAAWRERDFGCLQGLSKTDLFGGFPEFALGEVGYPAAEARPDSGETLLDVRERVLHAWAGLREAHAGSGDTVVVVSHGGPLRFVLGSLKGLDVVDTVLGIDQDNCALNEVSVASPPKLVRENVTEFLPDTVRTDSDTVA